jgi:hypothetical protein
MQDYDRKNTTILERLARVEKNFEEYSKNNTFRKGSPSYNQNSDDIRFVGYALARTKKNLESVPAQPFIKSVRGYRKIGTEMSGFILVECSVGSWIYTAFHKGEQTHQLAHLSFEWFKATIQSVQRKPNDWIKLGHEYIAKYGFIVGQPIPN